MVTPMTSEMIMSFLINWIPFIAYLLTSLIIIYIEIKTPLTDKTKVKIGKEVLRCWSTFIPPYEPMKIIANI